MSAPEVSVLKRWTTAEIVMMSRYHQHIQTAGHISSIIPDPGVCISELRQAITLRFIQTSLWTQVLSDVCVSKWMFVCWCLCLEAAVPPWVGYNEEETIQQQILALSAVSKNLIHYITVSTQSLSCPFWLNVCSLNVGQEKFLAWPSGWCPVPLRHGADVSSGCSDAGGRPAPQPHALWPGSKTVSTLLVCVCVVACSVHSVYFTLRVCFCRRVHQAQFNWPVESMSLNWCWCVCVWQCEGGGVLEELFLPGVSGEAVGSADSAGSPAAAAAAGRWGQGGHWGRLPNRSDSELCLLTTAEIIHMVILCVDVLVCNSPQTSRSLLGMYGWENSRDIVRVSTVLFYRCQSSSYWTHGVLGNSSPWTDADRPEITFS